MTVTINQTTVVIALSCIGVILNAYIGIKNHKEFVRKTKIWNKICQTSQTWRKSVLQISNTCLFGLLLWRMTFGTSVRLTANMFLAVFYIIYCLTSIGDHCFLLQQGRKQPLNHQ